MKESWEQFSNAFLLAPVLVAVIPNVPYHVPYRLNAQHFVPIAIGKGSVFARYLSPAVSTKSELVDVLALKSPTRMIKSSFLE